MSTLWFCVIIGFHGVYNSYSGHCPTDKEIVQYSFPSVHEDKLTVMYPWYTFLDSAYVDTIISQKAMLIKLGFNCHWNL